MTSQFAFLVLLSLTCASCVPSSFTSTIIPDSAPETAASSSPGIHSPTSEAFPTFNPFTNLGTVIIQRSPIQSLEITNITPSLTAATAETEQYSWMDEYFPKEIPEGAIDLSKIPLKDWDKQKFDRPGMGYIPIFQCKIPEKIKQLRKNNKYLSGFKLFLDDSNREYCRYGETSIEELEAWNSQHLNLTPEEQKKVIVKEEALMTALMDAFLANEKRYIDAAISISLSSIENSDVAIIVKDNSHPSTGKNSRLGIIDVPILKPNPTPTPQK